MVIIFHSNNKEKKRHVSNKCSVKLITIQGFEAMRRKGERLELGGVGRNLSCPLAGGNPGAEGQPCFLLGLVFSFSDEKADF